MQYILGELQYLVLEQDVVRPFSDDFLQILVDFVEFFVLFVPL